MHIDSSFFQPFVGTILGFFVSLGMFVLSQYYDRRKRMQEQKAQNIAVLRALSAEISVLTETLEGSVGEALLQTPDNTTFTAIVPVYEDYFSVYNTNTANLGKISDPVLVKEIVRTYTGAKSLIDSFRANNQFIKEYSDIILQFDFHKDSAELLARKISTEQRLSKYGGMLKRQYINYTTQCKETVAKISTIL